MNEKSSLKEIGSRAFATLMFYAASGALVLFVFIDVVLAIMLIAEFGKKDGFVGAYAITLGLTLFFSHLCAKAFKKFDKSRKKSVPEKPESSEDGSDENNEPLLVVSVEVEKPVRRRKRKNVVSPEFEIRYHDISGKETVRQIAVLGYNGRSIDAFCFLRNEERTFIVDSIDECVDLSTGELIQDDLHELFRSLCR